MKNIVAALIIICLGVTFAACGTENTGDDEAEVLALQQHDSRWSDYVSPGNTEGLGPTACGVFSAINAIYYLTGVTVDIYEIADFFAADGSYKDDGTYRYEAFCYGGTLEKYLADIGSELEVSLSKEWGGGKCGAKGLDEYLDRGEVCIIHIKGHFMCVAAHDKETDLYLTLDSSANAGRNTSCYGAWLDASYFEYGAVCGIDDGFCALKTSGTPAEHKLPRVELAKNSASCSVEIYGKGTAEIEEISGLNYTGAVGDEITLSVKPGLFYECTAVWVNGEALKLLNDGKKASYTFTLETTITTVYVCFAKK